MTTRPINLIRGLTMMVPEHEAPRFERFAYLMRCSNDGTEPSPARTEAELPGVHAIFDLIERVIEGAGTSGGCVTCGSRRIAGATIEFVSANACFALCRVCTSKFGSAAKVADA